MIDRDGIRRFQRFGHVDDLTLGSILGTLLAEPVKARETETKVAADCDEAGCTTPTAAW